MTDVCFSKNVPHFFLSFYARIIPSSCRESSPARAFDGSDIFQSLWDTMVGNISRGFEVDFECGIVGVVRGRTGFDS